MQIVVLTGFASIATAVEAIKLGARHYLAKPSNADDIEAAFGKTGGNAATSRSARARLRSRRSNGSGSMRHWPRPASTSRRPRASWACTAARWRGSWASGR
jgi:DNA-binding NtrC family response regulator